MKKGRSKYFLVMIMIVLILALTCVMYKAAGKTRFSFKKQEPNTTIELFVIAPCESCHEEDKFRREISNQMKLAGYDSNKIIVYNVYKESGAAHFSETVDKFQLNITTMDLPAAIANGCVYQGTYQEIGKALVKNFKKEATNEENNPVREQSLDEAYSGSMEQTTDAAFYSDVMGISEDDTALILFVTGACESCHEAQSYLEENLTDQSGLFIYNILEGTNLDLYQSLVRLYQVPESQQKVPILFTRVNYLSGVEAILNDTSKVLVNEEARGSWEKVLQSLSSEKEKHSISKLQLITTGLINGLNPCGISMLLMVLSVLLMSERSFFGGSLAYILGKFLTYLLLGFTIQTFLGAIESTAFWALQRGLKIVFAVLALSFGIFYLIDFIHVIKEDYGKVRLQLPVRLRKWNHEMIGKLLQIPGKFWIPMLFLLGIVISAGEFLCTGQVYLAELLYMERQNPGMGTQLFGNLTLYLMAMCIPLLLFVLMVSRAKTVISASHLSLKILPFIKLTYSFFFFVLFFMLLF